MMNTGHAPGSEHAAQTLLNPRDELHANFPMVVITAS